MSIESMLQYCIKKAKEGDSGGKIRVYSVAVDKRGNYLGEAMNSYVKTSPVMKKFSFLSGQNGKEYLHSEVRAILFAMKSNKIIDKLYIARVGKSGESLPSKPCVICQMFIEDYERLYNTRIKIICQT